MNINYPLEISLVAMLLAQFMKLPIYYLFYRKWFPSILFSTGGMPSSHSAFVTALTLSIALTQGISSPYFAISFVLAGVVIHDAVGIRRQAGKHATVLNNMKEEIADIVKELHKGKEKDDKIVEIKLKELLGHEPIEALTGTLLGVVVVLVSYFWII
ncbi:MAG: divergent PAP2 family protein [Bacilli bacterium]|nr:divergent PAP2 family protein [Bacilli bacterium]